MKPQFHQTVNILVQAYLNGTLEHGNYCACAVGNIIAESVGAKIIPSPSKNSCSKYAWEHPEYSGEEWFSKTRTGVTQIKTTGYSVNEIWMIEKAFENAQRYPNYVGCTDDEIMFNGLMAVVSVLAEIHGVDLETTGQARKLFVK